MIRFLSLTLTVAVWISWGSATPYNQHENPCAPIPDLPVSNCLGSCSGCVTTVKRFQERANSPMNVALNRPAVMKDYWLCGLSTEISCYCPVLAGNDACGAVNGLTTNYLSNGCGSAPYNCFHTACSTGGDWWYVDLEKPVTVKLITTLLRVGESDPLTTMEMSVFCGFLKRSCDIMIFIDAKLCSQTETLEQLNNLNIENIPEFAVTRFIYWCSTALRGRYVRFQKIENPGDLCLHYCEIEVYACSSNTKARGEWYHGSGELYCDDCGSSSACSQYPCDNYYGCFGPAQAMQRTTNVAAMKYVNGYSAQADYPISNVVDGVYTPRDFRCYQSTYSYDFNDYLHVRVHLELLYQIISAEVTSYSGTENTLIGFEVWVTTKSVQQPNNDNRVKGDDTLCWRKEGTLGTSYSQMCTDCAENLDNCPRARYVTFSPSSPTAYLKLCEVMAYGFPIKELSLGSVCGGACKLELCAGRLQCVNDLCKSAAGGPCSSDDECVSGSCTRQICNLNLNEDCSGRKAALCGSGLTCVHTLCKLSLGMGDCTTDDDCALLSNACDYAKKCRVRLGFACQKDPDCVAGARCQQNGQCACVTDYSSASNNDAMCEPKVYGKPCTHHSDCSALLNAVCNGTCKCNSCFKLNDRDFKCKSDVGCQCHPIDNPCIDTMTCEEAGNNINSAVCFVGFGGPCIPGRDRQCINGSDCDEISKLCLHKIGQSCVASNQCPTEGICQNERCVILRGRKCNSSLDNQCQHGSFCGVSAVSTDNQTTCISEVGNVCEEDSLCPIGTLCNYFSYGEAYCRIGIGKSCDPAKDMCRENARCSTQGQCLWKVGSPCPSNATCGSDALCDVDNKCRYKIGLNCSETPTHCQIRSRCNNQTNRCTCLGIVNNNTVCTIPPSPSSNQIPSLVSSLCEPLGVNDSRQAPCSDAGKAKCNETTSKCVCFDGYGPDENLECKPTASFRCASINENSTEKERTYRCAAGAVCEHEQCMLEVGSPCIEKERLYCVTGSTCDRDGKCKLLIGSSCGSDRLSGMCLQGTVCDPFQKCKYPIGSKKCQADSSCVVGAKCSKDGCNNFTCCQCDNTLSNPASVGQTCDIKSGKVGGECLPEKKCEDANAECLSNSGRCACKNGFEVSEIDLVCKVAEGFPCKATGDCVPGKVCDVKLNLCKLELGSSCTANKTADTSCADGAICAEGSCKIEESGLCDSEAKRPHCRVGTVCDIIGRCKKGVLSACNTTDECGAGMECRENLCKCYTLATTRLSGWCSPRKGRFGSPCTESSECPKEQSFCDSTTGTCGCTTDVIPRELTCHFDESRKSLPPLPSSIKIWLSILAALACVLLIIAVVYKKRGSEKKDDLKEEMAERMAMLQQMTVQLIEMESLQQAGAQPMESSEEQPDQTEANEEEQDEEDDQDGVKNLNVSE